MANFTDYGIAAGVGLADWGLQRLDAKGGRTGHRFSYQNIGRVGAVLAGMFGDRVLPRYAGTLNTVGIAATPLAVHTLLSMANIGAGAGVSYAPRTRAAAAPPSPSSGRLIRI